MKSYPSRRQSALRERQTESSRKIARTGKLKSFDNWSNAKTESIPRARDASAHCARRTAKARRKRPMVDLMVFGNQGGWYGNKMLTLFSLFCQTTNNCFFIFSSGSPSKICPVVCRRATPSKDTILSFYYPVMMVPVFLECVSGPELHFWHKKGPL